MEKNDNEKIILKKKIQKNQKNSETKLEKNQGKFGKKKLEFFFLNQEKNMARKYQMEKKLQNSFFT